MKKGNPFRSMNLRWVPNFLTMGLGVTVLGFLAWSIGGCSPGGALPLQGEPELSTPTPTPIPAPTDAPHIDRGELLQGVVQSVYDAYFPADRAVREAKETLDSIEASEAFLEVKLVSVIDSLRSAESELRNYTPLYNILYQYENNNPENYRHGQPNLNAIVKLSLESMDYFSLVAKLNSILVEQSALVEELENQLVIARRAYIASGTVQGSLEERQFRTLTGQLEGAQSFEVQLRDFLSRDPLLKRIEGWHVQYESTKTNYEGIPGKYKDALVVYESALKIFIPIEVKYNLASSVWYAYAQERGLTLLEGFAGDFSIYCPQLQTIWKWGIEDTLEGCK